jgi:hypothetical protein
MQRSKKYLIGLGLLLVSNLLLAQQTVGIVGLNKFHFGPLEPGSTKLMSVQEICVYSLDSGNYTVSAMGRTNKKGHLGLENKGKFVPVTVAWAGEILKANKALALSGAATTALTECGGEGKVEVKLTIHAPKKLPMKPGDYNVDIHFELHHEVAAADAKPATPAA